MQQLISLLFYRSRWILFILVYVAHCYFESREAELGPQLHAWKKYEVGQICFLFS